MNPDDGLTVSKMLLEAIQGGRWTLVASLAVVLAIWGTRRFGGQWWPFLADRRVIVVLAIVGPAAVSIAMAIAGGQGVTLGVILSGLVTGLGAVGMWSAQKNVREAFTTGAPSAESLRRGSLLGDRPPGQPLR